MADRAASVLIEIDQISKAFSVRGETQQRLVLDRVDLGICKGEVVVLLGPSGCGKSTLLNMIAGFLAPSTGKIVHDGAVVSRPDRRRTVVFQDYALFPWMTVQKNVEFGLKALGLPAKERARIARSFLATVRLNGFEERYPHEISGGMKQRAAIARGLAPDPDVLLMDEPFGALDAQTRVLLQEELARIVHETQKTVVFVTHSIEEAVFLGDKVVVLGTNPARVRSVYPVDLPKPRNSDTRSDPRYVTLTRELWDALKAEWDDRSADAT